MKSFGVVALLALGVHACGDNAGRHEHYPRQNPPAGAPSGTNTSGSTTGTGTGTGAGTGTGTGPSYTFTLAATNPTAIPLASITANMESRPTQALEYTAAPGDVPAGVEGAPGLPDLSAHNPADYPGLDAIPPVDSPEVLQWIEEVKNSGIDIPGLEKTTGADCTAHPDFAQDASRCWWTCGGCVAPEDITECNKPNHWGLTFDDGPGYYTSNLLQYLDQVQLKATFFVVGSRVVTFPHTLQTEYAGGHQIAVHTWSHRALTNLTNEEVIAELGWTKKVIKDVLGVTPSHMRPPFGDIDNRVRAISMAMGLTPVMWTRTPDGLAMNTQDFDINGGTATVEQVLSQWKNITNKIPELDKGFIVLQHDLFQASVDVATGYILPDGMTINPPLVIEPVITCVEMPDGNAYIETNDNSTNPFKAKLGISSGGGGGDTGDATRSGFKTLGAMVLGGAGVAAGLLL